MSWAVLGAAAGLVIYKMYPGANGQVWRDGVQLLPELRRAEGHAGDGGEPRPSGRCNGSGGARDRNAAGAGGGRGLAELQPDPDVGPLLAAGPDHDRKRRADQGPLHLRHRGLHRLRIRPDHGGGGADRHHRVRHLLARSGDLRRELAHARGHPAEHSGGQPRRRLLGRHALSRHPGRTGAGLRLQDRQAAVGDDHRRSEASARRSRRRRSPGTAWSTSARPAATTRA